MLVTRSRPAGTTTSNAVDSSQHDAELQPERILVVADDLFIRTSLSSPLRMAGHTVSVVASEREAMARLCAPQEVDLVLCGLDGTAGDRILDHVKSRYPGIPVIVISGIYHPEVVNDSLRRGAYDYLPKPVEEAMLQKTVDRALEFRRRIRQDIGYRLSLEDEVRRRTEMLEQTFSHLRGTQDIVFELLIESLTLRGVEEDLHSQRVSSYALSLAKGLNLSPAELGTISRAGFVHDIGNLAVPDALLRKSEPLTPEETEILQDHCWFGYKLLQRLRFASDLAEIVYCLHEHYDGTGYPRKLQGETIPLASRIVAVAEFLEDITTDSPRQKAIAFEEARAEIRSRSGGQFDPSVVQTYLSFSDKVWLGLRENIAARPREFLLDWKRAV